MCIMLIEPSQAEASIEHCAPCQFNDSDEDPATHDKAKSIAVCLAGLGTLNQS